MYGTVIVEQHESQSLPGIEIHAVTRLARNALVVAAACPCAVAGSAQAPAADFESFSVSGTARERG